MPTALKLSQNLIVPAADLSKIAALQRIVDNSAMFNLTRQQQLFLCVVMLLLLTGWAVKAWRTAHPPAQSAVVPVR